MNMEYVLWAVKIEDRDWEEDIILCTTDKEKIKEARVWAEANGYNRLRESTFTLKKNYNASADFAGTVKI